MLFRHIPAPFPSSPLASRPLKTSFDGKFDTASLIEIPSPWNDGMTSTVGCTFLYPAGGTDLGSSALRDSGSNMTDPKAKLHRKGNARPCYMGHVLMENRNGSGSCGRRDAGIRQSGTRGSPQPIDHHRSAERRITLDAD
jgi:hypothetical protein